MHCKQSTHASTGAMWFTASGKYCGWTGAGVVCSAVNDDEEIVSFSQLAVLCLCRQRVSAQMHHIIHSGRSRISKREGPRSSTKGERTRAPNAPRGVMYSTGGGVWKLVMPLPQLCPSPEIFFEFRSQIIIIIINGVFSVALSNKVTARSTIACDIRFVGAFWAIFPVHFNWF